MEDAFAGDLKDGEGSCPAESACSANRPDGGGYCILSCNKFNTPLFCSSNFPQVPVLPTPMSVAPCTLYSGVKKLRIATLAFGKGATENGP